MSMNDSKQDEQIEQIVHLAKPADGVPDVTHPDTHVLF